MTNSLEPHFGWHSRGYLHTSMAASWPSFLHFACTMRCLNPSSSVGAKNKNS